MADTNKTYTGVDPSGYQYTRDPKNSVPFWVDGGDPVPAGDYVKECGADVVTVGDARRYDFYYVDKNDDKHTYASVTPGSGGGTGTGYTYTPHISAITGGHRLTWTTDDPAGVVPDPVDIMDGAKGDKGEQGSAGITFTPAAGIKSDGRRYISWSNDGDKQNPSTLYWSDGTNGATFTPSIEEDSTSKPKSYTMTWTNDGGKDNPPSVTWHDGESSGDMEYQALEDYTYIDESLFISCVYATYDDNYLNIAIPFELYPQYQSEKSGLIPFTINSKTYYLHVNITQSVFYVLGVFKPADELATFTILNIEGVKCPWYKFGLVSADLTDEDLKCFSVHLTESAKANMWVYKIPIAGGAVESGNWGATIDDNSILTFWINGVWASGTKTAECVWDRYKLRADIDESGNVSYYIGTNGFIYDGTNLVSSTGRVGQSISITGDIAGYK